MAKKAQLFLEVIVDEPLEKKELKQEQSGDISRRGFLLTTLGTLAGIYIAHESLSSILRPPTYAEAMHDPSKRQAYAESLLTKENYFTVEYLSPEVLKKLTPEQEEQLAQYAAETRFAVTIRDEILFRQGKKSKIFLTNRCFKNPFTKYTSEGLHDLDLILRNIMQYHERLHADHFHHGLVEIDVRKFFKNDGEFNLKAFQEVSELLAHQSEYRHLQDLIAKEKSGLISRYQSIFPSTLEAHYNALCSTEGVEGLDPAFVQMLKTEFNPKKLLEK